MIFLSKVMNRVPKHKHLKQIGEGKDGNVFDYAADKILKIAKQKTFIDGTVLSDLNDLSTFPTLFEKGKNWYIAEKFTGISVVNTPLKPDWKDVFLQDVEEAFDRGWKVEDLHLSNVLNVEGYIKILDVGRFEVSDFSEKKNDLLWIDYLIDNLVVGKEIFEVV